jgi:hypothetical protein
MARRLISDEEVDRAVALLRTGLTVDEVAARTGIRTNSLYTHLSRRGLTATGEPGRARDHRRPPTERRLAERAHRDRALALHERGLTFAEIGAEMGVTSGQASYLCHAAYGERGPATPTRQAPLRPLHRVAETQERLDRLDLSWTAGGLCGWCGRPLDAAETVYVDRFTVVAPDLVRPSSMRGRDRMLAPVGIECATPELLAAVAGREPEPCVSCGRGVLYRQANGNRVRVTCSRRCRDTYSRRHSKASPTHE